MKQLLAISLIALSALSASALDYVTWTMTVTNGTTTNDAVGFSGAVRQGATNRTSTTFQTNSVAGFSASNIFSQVGGWPIQGMTVTQLNTTLVFRGIGLVVTSTPFASLSAVTNSTNGFRPVQVPFSAFPASVQRSNASDLVTGLQQATNALPENTPFASNFVNRAGVQTLSNKTLNLPIINGIANTVTGASFNGVTASNLTGTIRTFYASNGIIHTLIVTNFSSPGTGSASQQIGSLATASGVDSIAFGVSALASGDSATAVGSSAQATNQYDSAFGNLARAYGGLATAIGVGALADASGATALGGAATASYADSVAIGTGAATTTNNQVMLGTDAGTVSAPGRFSAGTITNAIITGQSTVSSDLALITLAKTLANGDNSDVVVGSNVLIQLTGPTAAYTVSSLVSTRAGDFKIVIADNPAHSFTLLHNSGIGTPADANKLWLVNTQNVVLTNRYATFHAINRSSNWLVIPIGN